MLQLVDAHFKKEQTEEEAKEKAKAKEKERIEEEAKDLEELDLE